MTRKKQFTGKNRNQTKCKIVVKKETGNTGGANTKSNSLFDMGKLQSVEMATKGKLLMDLTSESETEEEEDNFQLHPQTPPSPPRKSLTISRLLELLAETPLIPITPNNNNPQLSPVLGIAEQELTTELSRPNSQTVRKVEFSTKSVMNSSKNKKKSPPREIVRKTEERRSPTRGRIAGSILATQRLRSRSRSGSLLEEIREMSLESQDAQEAKKKKKVCYEVENNKKRRKRRKRREDDYTDMTRAAALTLGSRDLKQSLKAKKKRDRKMHVEIDLLTKEEFFSAMLVVEATFHMKSKNQAAIALKTLNKALKLQPSHKGALIARSQCYLSMGDAASALKDAQTTFDTDENETFIQGLFQFAEALYQLGQFEKALIAYHQGMRLRKDMEGFRLGVRKSQEAIRRAIGDRSATHLGNLDDILPAIMEMEAANKKNVNSNSNYKNDGICTKSNARARWVAREVLGQMYCDKDYLVKFLERPGIKNNYGGSNAVRDSAKEALKYLEIREQFWRQQNPLYSRKTNIPPRLTKNSGQCGNPSKIKP